MSRFTFEHSNDHHHYHGVLAPSSSYRTRVTQFANQQWRSAKPKSLDQFEVEKKTVFTGQHSSIFQIKKSAACWAKLIKKIYEMKRINSTSTLGIPMHLNSDDMSEFSNF